MLRAALLATLQDQEFLADAQKQFLPLDPVTGEEAAQVVNAIYAAPPALAKKVKDVLD